MYVGPKESDYVAPSGVRELAVVDSGYNIHFIRIFGEKAYSYGNTLLLAEQNGAILVAHNLKIDQASSKIFFTFFYIANLY
jgi:hypothetical protein